MEKAENIFSDQKLPDINFRVKTLIDYYTNGSVKRFSELIKLSSSQKLNRIFNIDKRNGEYPEVSSDILISIANMFSDVDARWLLTGQGEMFLSNDKSKYFRSDNELIETQRELIIQLKARISSLEEKLNQSTSEIKKTILGN